MATRRRMPQFRYHSPRSRLDCAPDKTGTCGDETTINSAPEHPLWWSTSIRYAKTLWRFTGPLPPQRFTLHYRQRLDYFPENTLGSDLNPTPALEAIAAYPDVRVCRDRPSRLPDGRQTGTRIGRFATVYDDLLREAPSRFQRIHFLL